MTPSMLGWMFTRQRCRKGEQAYTERASLISACGQKGWPDTFLLARPSAHPCGVNPSVETVWNWHTCGSMVFPSHSSSSLSGWPSAGEAEASSAGEQLAEE